MAYDLRLKRPWSAGSSASALLTVPPLQGDLSLARPSARLRPHAAMPPSSTSIGMDSFDVRVASENPSNPRQKTILYQIVGEPESVSGNTRNVCLRKTFAVLCECSFGRASGAEGYRFDSCRGYLSQFPSACDSSRQSMMVQQLRRSPSAPPSSLSRRPLLTRVAHLCQLETLAHSHNAARPVFLALKASASVLMEPEQWRLHLAIRAHAFDRSHPPAPPNPSRTANEYSTGIASDRPCGELSGLSSIHRTGASIWS